jgi:hypothetical protein
LSKLQLPSAFFCSSPLASGQAMSPSPLAASPPSHRCSSSHFYLRQTMLLLLHITHPTSAPSSPPSQMQGMPSGDSTPGNRQHSRWILFQAPLLKSPIFFAVTDGERDRSAQFPPVCCASLFPVWLGRYSNSGPLDSSRQLATPQKKGKARSGQVSVPRTNNHSTSPRGTLKKNVDRHKAALSYGESSVELTVREQLE